MHNFYNSMENICGPKNCSVTPLKTVDGLTLLKDQNQILLRLAEHFEALLNQPSSADLTILEELPDCSTIHDLTQPSTFMEVLAAVRALKDNKSPGTDSIPAELLKLGGYICTRTIHQYITKAWAEESIPKQWRDAKIVTIYKNKGDKSICSNSRGISLLAFAGKVLAKVMLQRPINHLTESMLPKSQCRFRKNRSMVDMIFIARQLQQKCREQHLDLFMASIDLSKAFDTINRELL